MADLQFLVPPKVPSLSADPASASAGDIYFNTSTNKLRVYNGSTWDELGGASAATPQISFSTMFDGSGHISDLSSTGTVNPGGTYGLLLDTTTSNGYCYARVAFSQGAVDDATAAGGVTIISMALSKSTLMNATPTFDFFAGYACNVTAPADTGIDYTLSQFGLKIVAAAGSPAWYASNGNGTSETATNFTAPSNFMSGYDEMFTAVRNGTTNIKYYRNRTLVATHTTNMPNLGSATFHVPGDFRLTNKQSGVEAAIWISMYSITKDAY